MSERARFPVQLRYTKGGKLVPFSVNELLEQIWLVLGEPPPVFREWPDGTHRRTWLVPEDASRSGFPADRWPEKGEPMPLFALRMLTHVWCTEPAAKSMVAAVIQGVLGIGVRLQHEAVEGAIPAILTKRAIEAALVRHAENHGMKRDAMKWYVEHKGEYRSKDAAAKAIAGKVVPASFATVRRWLREKKRPQSLRAQARRYPHGP